MQSCLPDFLFPVKIKLGQVILNIKTMGLSDGPFRYLAG